jgi:ornithine carbamoyltransferase
MTKPAHRHFLAISSLSREDLREIIGMAQRLKAASRAALAETRREPAHLDGKTLAAIYEKPSLRTRCSFETGMFQLGGHAINLQASEIGKLGERESISDLARNLSRWVQVITARVFYHPTLEELAEWSTVPIINALSDFEHPTQIIADYLTILEHHGTIDGFRLGWVGDGYNVCNSLMFMAAIFDNEMVMAIPHNYDPRMTVWEMVRNLNPKAEKTIRLVRDPKEAALGADVLYTDIWTSMGYEAEAMIRKKAFQNFQINQEVLDLAPAHAFVLHDMPAKRGLEITDEVMDGPRCRAFDQAENRLHAIKAILCWSLGIEV